MRQILALAATAALTLAALPAAAQAPSSSPDPAAARAGTFVTDPGHSKITWSVNHFGFSTYLGQFSQLSANLKVDPKAPAATTLEATVQTASIGTFNPALDTHLKSPDFLDVAQFPTATFKATSVKPTGERTAEVTGDLTLHGVTKPVTPQVTFIRGGMNPVDRNTYRLGFQGRTILKRSEFGIKTYVPVISDEVAMQIDAEFVAKP